MPTAFCLVRQNEAYPWEAISEGAARCGFDIQFTYSEPKRDDIFLMWTPWDDSMAGYVYKKFRERCVVFENGYIPVDAQGRGYYAMGLGGFNGIGDHRNQGRGPERWDSFGLEIREPKKVDQTCLVMGQRAGIDIRWTMPYHWHLGAVNRMKRSFKEVRFRPHPARPRHAYDVSVPIARGPLHSVLSEVSYVAVWNSKAVCEALRLGCYAIIEAPNSIAKGVLPGDRQFFYDLAYAQWRPDEIATGEPLRRLL